ncbi:hypothetical protein [Baaleninema sp.]|uniref:hypothetical protein n=1 Tax=Baaleninema sp. TaxID=3101197 RepID=UPI003D00EA5B
MTGFIRGLFGRKKEQPEQQTVKSEGSSQAYFLNQDDAKTLGDIDYMRKSRQIRRTFPKVEGAPSERVRQVSAMEERDYTSEPQSSTGTSQTSSTSSSSSDFQRRTANTDTNMDMFRNMAKNIKGR